MLSRMLHTRLPLATTLIAAGTVMVLLSAGDALADPGGRSRHWTATVTGSRGGTSTVDHTRNWAPGTRSNQTVVTGPQGGQWSHGATRTWDPSTGTGTLSRNTIHRNGTVSETTGTVTRTAPGAYDVERTYTGRGGNSRSWSGTVTVDR